MNVTRDTYRVGLPWHPSERSKGQLASLELPLSHLLLGRKTYEIFAAHWPHVADDPIADALNRATKHVASRSLTSVQWEKSRLLAGISPKPSRG